MKKKIFFLLFSALLFAGYSFAEVWQDVTGNLSDRNFYAITGSRYGSAVYIGTENGLYRKIDNGQWKQIFACRGEHRGVNDIYVNNENAIYIATKNGLYKSGDLGKKWDRIFRGIEEEKHTTSVACDGKNEKTIYLGTHKGLFLTENDGKTWKRFPGIFGKSKIDSIALGGKESFVICNNSIYKIAKNSGNSENYKKIFSSDSFSSEDEIIFSLNDIRYKNAVLYLSTNRGLFISKNKGTLWDRFDDTGLSNRWINNALALKTNSRVFVATKNGVFEYRGAGRKWSKIYAGMDSTNVKRLAVTRPGDYIWALCDARVYRMKRDDLGGPSRKEESDTDEILLKFADEPTINEVQAMAIEYAEVYPEKIEKWRRGATYRAVLPKVTFGIDESTSDTYSLSTNPKYETIVIGPDDITTGWDLNFTWDLGDLIWNESQTSIDVRSKLMVQLRDDIVDEVTRIYFERRRLQIENVTNPPQNLQAKLKKELRIQELTAGIDGLTGGHFSKAINENS